MKLWTHDHSTMSGSAWRGVTCFHFSAHRPIAVSTPHSSRPAGVASYSDPRPSGLSGLLALFNSVEPEHDVVSRLVAEIDDPLVVSPYVVAELDYLVGSPVGVDAELAVLEELAGGAYELAQLDASDLERASGPLSTWFEALKARSITRRGRGRRLGCR